MSSATHGIYKSLDEGYETKSVFLDISKDFGKVWHECLLHKLRENGMSGQLLNIVTDFSYQRKQRDNGQYSSWAAIEAGVPQGSILGPLFFLIHISDLSDDLASNVEFFVDDTSLFSVVENVTKSADD